MEKLLLIHNINILDVENDKTLQNVSILVENGVITQIGQVTKEYPSARVFDARGHWAVPSFIDLHAHITFHSRVHHYPGAFHFDEDNDLSLIRGAQNLLEALEAGVCLVRDMGSKGNKATLLKSLVDSENIPGPEIVLSGEPFCISGGHGFEFGQAIDVSNMDRMLDNHFELGYEWLKIMNGPELFDESLLKLIIEKAHRLGIRVAVHAFTESGIASSIRAHSDTIEHAVVYDDQELMEIAKNYQTQFVPTFYCAWLSLREDFLQTIPRIERDYLCEWYEYLDKNFRFHIDHGFPVAVGTDAGSAPCTFFDCVEEVKMLHGKGLPIVSAIKSATILPAQILGRENKYGSIAVGKWANMLMLEKNPVDNIDALDRVKVVWYRGLDIFNHLESPWN